MLLNARNPLRSLYRTALLYPWRTSILVALVLLLESYIHVRNYDVPRPAEPLDKPFYLGCQDPLLNTTARASAVLVMLAKNTEVKGAIASVRSVQEQFNDAFGYPWVFLNNVEWSEEFKRKVGKAVGEGIDVKFETIPKEMWGYPEWIDQDRARRNMQVMKEKKIQYGGSESYRHMCRFNAGFFFDHDAILPYKYYWRVEPDIKFTCALTYDPFVAMQTSEKKYGYNIALWERGETVASLFRKLSDYKSRHYLSPSPLWTAMIDASWMPWPFRRALALLRNRDGKGDLWNTCHFWSNFEIADLDFFRSKAYRSIFDFLDRDGGFYYERWGDAAVHSLAAAMLLKPEELHHFSDLGYIHGDLQYCTPTGIPPEEPWKKIKGLSEDVGCRCKCSPEEKVVEAVCLNRIGSAMY